MALIVLLFVVALLVLLFARLAGGGGGAGGPAASANPIRGGTLTMAFQNEPGGLDPAVAGDAASATVETLCYRTLLQYKPVAGAAGTELVPDVATEVPTVGNGGISAGGRTYTFHLRRGVRFAPPLSREVTAQDFKYSFERMMSDPLATSTSFFTGIVGAQAYLDGAAKHIGGYQVVDPRTVRVTLTKPDASFLNVMTMACTSVVPREQVAKYGGQFDHHPLGCGPFTLDHWTPGREIVMKRNPDYYARGLPYLDGVRFVFGASPSTALRKLERGQLDVLGDLIPPRDYAAARSDHAGGGYLASAPQLASIYLFMNVTQKPFDNKRVRQAVSYAVDPAHIQKVIGAQGQPLAQIYPQGLPGHVGGKTYYARDVAKAKRLLAKAGYGTGLATTLYAPAVDPYPQLAEALQVDLGEAGIRVSVKQMDPATYATAITLKRSHIAMGLSNWYADYPDPSDWIGPLFTAPADGSADVSFYSSPQVDALFKASVGELDPQKRLGLFAQMQDIIMADAPTVPLSQPVRNAMCGSDVGGFYLQTVNLFDLVHYWKLGGR